ncbi:DnaD domain-containing protein [Staphylococcus carnosus]|uniref:DNA replication protein DnaD n=2 Tax=Staphylococcus carnosus TaxID=1281 RepID=B9DNW7_STACT|nr:DnaD domain-containing protein [Staphylococcus carnosus]KKB26265.1 chromosome replication protein DnaD [Staphylococcus carnosus]KOR13643.1 chromosome replication protein DnaD [Staphylococcus carnosus]POA00313.1 DnaD domain protein [Staphylococcus carnosus]QPT04128.1 DnaD domain-containing protein [Staphylococcus carnosus]QQS85228.1 DnaD domain-containing protein [Staphylococcus carnosus]
MDIDFLRKRPMVFRRELLDHYAELGLTETDLVILMKLIYENEHSNKQPSIQYLCQGTTMKEREVTGVIQRLIQLDLFNLTVQKDEEGRFAEFMDLDGFYNSFKNVLEKESLRHKEQSDEETFKDLFQFIEQSFGRPLSPIEIDTLNQWIDVDNHDISVIQAAVNEALSQEKINFKYIDRILLNWKKNNVKTVDDSKKISQQYHTPQMKHTVKNIPKFDWLNEEDS